MDSNNDGTTLLLGSYTVGGVGIASNPAILVPWSTTTAENQNEYLYSPTFTVSVGSSDRLSFDALNYFTGINATDITVLVLYAGEWIH